MCRHVSSEVIALVRGSDLYETEKPLPVGVSLCLNTAQYAVSCLICPIGRIKEVCLKYLDFNYIVTYCFIQLQCVIK